MFSVCTPFPSSPSPFPFLGLSFILFLFLLFLPLAPGSSPIDYLLLIFGLILDIRWLDATNCWHSMNNFLKLALPFASLNNEEFACIRSGPRIYYVHGRRHERVSVSGSHISHFLGSGCSHFRVAGNYIAGYTKRVLRKLRPKGLPKTAEGFLGLCVELQLHVNAGIPVLLMNLNTAW